MQAANPYRPNTDHEYLPSAFAGRSEAYNRINQHFADPTAGQAAAFSGRRHIGKSALLWHFREFFPEQYVGVYVPLRRLQANLMTEFEVMETLASYTRQVLADRGAPMTAIPDEPSGGITRGWFRDAFLPGVFRELRRRGRLVLLLDDADILLARAEEGNIAVDFFEYLSELLETNAELGMVITLREESEEMAGTLAPLTDIAHIHRLEEMTAEETALLMRIPEEYRLTDEAVAAVHRATGGQPLLSQQVGYALYERATDPDGTKPLLDEKDVTAVMGWAVEQSHEQFREAWLALSLEERLVLTAVSDLMYERPLDPAPPAQISRWLVRADYPLDATTIRAALRGLEYAHMIHHEGDGARVAAGLLQSWLLKNAALEGNGTGTAGAGVRRGVIVGVVIAMLVLLVVVAVSEGVDRKSVV